MVQQNKESLDRCISFEIVHQTKKDLWDWTKTSHSCLMINIINIIAFQVERTGSRRVNSVVRV